MLSSLLPLFPLTIGRTALIYPYPYFNSIRGTLIQM